MNKKLKVILIVAASVILTTILYIFFIHPRLALGLQTLGVYAGMGGNFDIGEPILAYERYDVTDDTFTMADYGSFTVKVPSDWENISDEGSKFIRYGLERYTGEAEVMEFIYSSGNGENYSDMTLLNRELYKTEDEWHRINKGFEQLGYGMPTTAYDSFRCALMMEANDYNLFNYNKSLAFTYALPYRANSFFLYDGVTSWSYLYEDENKCGFIHEQYRENEDFYRYIIEFYDTDDLNTEYIIALNMKDRDTAYTIINSLEFKD